MPTSFLRFSILGFGPSEIHTLTAALKAQAAQIQKVSDQIKAQAPAPRVVANN